MNRIKTFVASTAGLGDLIATAANFCARVESGEVRSVATYGKFKEAFKLFNEAVAEAEESGPKASGGNPPSLNKDFTPMEACGTLVYMGRAGGFDVRHCPEPEALAKFIVESCNAAKSRSVEIPIKIDAKDAIQAVHGMSDLVSACIKYTRSDNATEHAFGEIEEALNKIAERHILDDMSFDPVAHIEAPQALSQQPIVDDLAMLVRQLVHALGKAAPSHGLPARAVDYLQRKGLAGSPLRPAAAQPSPAPADAVPAQTGMQGEALGQVADWMECERISNEDHVDEALRAFTEDPTQDNATGIIQAAITVYAADRTALAQRAASQPDSDRATFFDQPGNPDIPDMEEDFGRLLVKIRAALDFVVNGPVAGMELPQREIDKKFNSIVVDLIPEVQTMLESRIMVKHPFAKLADLFFNERLGTGLNGAQRFNHAVAGDISIGNSYGKLYSADPKHQPQLVMDQLAYMTTCMQVIMNLYGWRWDDVKLKARQQMAGSSQ